MPQQACCSGHTAALVDPSTWDDTFEMISPLQQPAQSARSSTGSCLCLKHRETRQAAPAASSTCSIKSHSQLDPTASSLIRGQEASHIPELQTVYRMPQDELRRHGCHMLARNGWRAGGADGQHGWWLLLHISATTRQIVCVLPASESIISCCRIHLAVPGPRTASGMC
jgi:hypothetical protein